MDINILAFIFALCLIIFIFYMYKRRESFDIPLRESSAWGWNVGPGYGAGYGTGYAMWGMWPANLPRQPWKNWMWGRRPLVFVRPFTPVPQIDYNNAPPLSKPTSNYRISLLPKNGRIYLSVNGFVTPTLQLDRGRNYYFHVYTPGEAFVISDGKQNLFQPLTEGEVTLRFDESDPDMLFYRIPNDPENGGIIYLN